MMLCFLILFSGCSSTSIFSAGSNIRKTMPDPSTTKDKGVTQTAIRSEIRPEGWIKSWPTPIEAYSGRKYNWITEEGNVGYSDGHGGACIWNSGGID
jgi:hypothetical protein